MPAGKFVISMLLIVLFTISDLINTLFALNNWILLLVVCAV